MLKLPTQNKIFVDATKYVSVVANDAFHPSRLTTMLINPEEIASIELVGYGVLDNSKTPIVQLNYKNGWSEQVFDAYAVWIR